MEEALEWSMVSITSVERPESMSWAPSEATPIAYTTLGGGEGFKRKGLSLPESPTESCRGGTLGLRTMPWPASKTPGSIAIGGKVHRLSHLRLAEFPTNLDHHLRVESPYPRPQPQLDRMSAP